MSDAIQSTHSRVREQLSPRTEIYRMNFILYQHPSKSHDGKPERESSGSCAQSMEPEIIMRQQPIYSRMLW